MHDYVYPNCGLHEYQPEPPPCWHFFPFRSAESLLRRKFKTFLSTDAVAYSRAYFGAGSGPILLDDVRCTGSETALINCTYDRFTYDCGHYEDAGVRCQGQILLLYEDTCIGQLNLSAG